MSLIAAGLGCGKKGPPLAPLRILPRPAQNVHVRQVGSDVVLEAAVSLSRTDGSPLGAGAVVQVMKMRPGPALKPARVSARYLVQVFQKEAKVVAPISGPDLQNKIASGHLVYHDRDAAGGEPSAAEGAPELRFLYAVRVVDQEGKGSALSMPQEISLVPPSPPPTDLAATVGEGEVRLTWESSGAGKPEASYNVYRRAASQEEMPLQPLNPAPLSDRAYVDTLFHYGETYFYSVRALANPPPPLRESAPSAEVEVRPLDVYAPKTPTGLAAAVEGQAIKLYWFPNSEPDLQGYRIHRRETRGDFRLLGEVGAGETSYADATAARGVRYYYAVTAVDGTTPPNESARSDEVSEVVPADAGP
ncbi:MAG TPA: hypothetical protein VKF61_11735 [Candidatus Polarisedimenticolia bacterium]|nr:hypothetical protein [Candidatus Polarisedimenticolia bacterium]